MKVILITVPELSGRSNRKMAEATKEDTLGHVMSSPVVSVTPKDTLRAAAKEDGETWNRCCDGSRWK